MSYLAKFFPPLRRRDRSKHHLSYIESVSPIMVADFSVVFLDRGKPSTKCEVINVESPKKIQINEHSQSSL